MKVIVIGGGPAGMMAAITASQNKNEVILLEKMPSLGKKLLITGKGRCNITSSLDIEDFIKNTPGNGKFLYSAFHNFTNLDIIKFLKEQGLEVKEERGNRIFPVTDKSTDVLQCFKNKIQELNIKVKYSTAVKEIITEENNFSDMKEKDAENINQKEARKEEKTRYKIIGVRTENETIYADKVILATGGMSYPSTGSTGDGYKLAKSLGHTITEIKPSLIPMVCYEKDVVSSLQGLSLKNVKIKIEDISKHKVIYEDFGEMLFTHFGVSGPIILSASAYVGKYKDFEELFKNRKIKLSIDLKPALPFEKLDERILRDFSELKNKAFKNSLDKLLPKKMIDIIIEISKIDPDKKVNEITKQERQNLVKLLKNFELYIKEFRPIDEAIITSGGVSCKEVNPKTMESKLVKGLYFAGEILDVDSYTGGFNLQIAYSTGFTAGNLL